MIREFSWRPTLASAVLALAIVLRIAGAALNYEANDDHMAVVRIIAHEHRLPADDEEWEAFQPKLYHATVAAVPGGHHHPAAAARFPA
jgi:hypothetical protein